MNLHMGGFGDLGIRVLVAQQPYYDKGTPFLGVAYFIREPRTKKSVKGTTGLPRSRVLGFRARVGL